MEIISNQENFEDAPITKKLLAMKADMTEEEKEEFLRIHFGIDFTKPIDFEKALDHSLVALIQKERIQKEMEEYLEKCIMQEYNLSNTDEAYQKWDEFKEKHNIKN